jgi:hypothetical protein
VTGPPALVDVALAYHEGGWHPLPLPARKKAKPPDGHTGYGGSDLTAAEIAEAAWTGNIALRMPPDVIGLDVDVYKGGDETLAGLLARCGPLPPTWISHSGRNDGSGIRFYRVPTGLAWIPGLPGIEIIQRVHRYAVVYPSIHPEGRVYGIADQAEARLDAELPPVEDLPELPWPWIAELSRAQQADVDAKERSHAVDLAGLSVFVDGHVQADQPSYVTTIFEHFSERTAAGYSRHDTMQHCLLWSLECVRAGIAAARPTLESLGELWVGALGDDRRRAELWSDRRTTEFEAMLRHAVGKVMAKPEAEILKIHDDIAGVPMRPLTLVPDPPLAVEAAEETETEDSLPRPINWAAFVERDETERVWLVEGFWPWGRSMALWAAAKTGKSELALWCAAKLALGEHPWTGDATEPIDVAYFDYEMTEDDLEDRLAAFNIAPRRLARLHYFLLPALHALDVEAGGTEVEALVNRHGAQAVIFDTFGRAVGGDENEADTVRAFYRFTGSRLKRNGIGYIRTDHAGKDESKGQRGSSAKRDDVDIVWSMTRSGAGVLLDCSGGSRLNWVGPTLKLERTEPDGVLSYSAPMRMGWPAGTAEKIADLDALGLPLDVSRRAARAALEAAGYLPGRNEILGAALRFRRERAQSSGGQQREPGVGLRDETRDF